MSGVAGAPRLPVRVRLLFIFLLISVIPLATLGMVAYTRALSLARADAAAGTRLVGELGLIIAFIVGVGTLAAIGLAVFAARSVADPLRRLEKAMAQVGRGELDTSCPVVANDEIGAVAEGFNRMLEGLRERERTQQGRSETIGQPIAGTSRRGSSGPSRVRWSGISTTISRRWREPSERTAGSCSNT